MQALPSRVISESVYPEYHRRALTPGSFPGYAFRESSLMDHFRGCAKGKQIFSPFASRRPAGSRFPVPWPVRRLRSGRNSRIALKPGALVPRRGCRPGWLGEAACVGPKGCQGNSNQMEPTVHHSGDASAREGGHGNGKLPETRAFSPHLNCTVRYCLGSAVRLFLP